jgi:polysaccharide biosynthesis protein PslG
MRLLGRDVISGVLIIALAVSTVAGCGGGDSEATPPEQERTHTPQPSRSTATTLPGTTETPQQGASTPTSTVAAIVSSATPTPEPTRDTSVRSEATPASPTSPSGESGFAYGFNVFARGDDTGAEFNDQTIGLVQDAGFGWIRIQIYWRAIQQQRGWWDPLGVDRIVEQYGGEGIRILASISAPPDWAVDPTGERFIADIAEWEEFVAFLADRYKGRIHAWEIWNEQNLAYTVGGTVRLAEYCDILESSYRAIKAADQDALVVFGGLTPTGVNDPAIAIDDVDYLKAFYNHEGGRYTAFFDIMGMHANATNNPPDTMWPENPGPGDWTDDTSFYFRRVELQRDVMLANGDDRPVWITEFGWTTENLEAGYEYGADVSEEQQAEYLVRAFEIGTSEWEWCTGMFVWNLNFSTITGPEDEKYPWSVLNSDWTPRPAYEALANMPKD